MAEKAEINKMEKGSPSSNPGVERNAVSKPTSPLIRISKLIEKLSSSLSNDKIRAIKKLENDLKERKIAQRKAVRLLRVVVNDDELLISTIKAYVTELTAPQVVEKKVE